MTHLPTFNRSLLHPRYWLTWLGIGLLYVLVLLPYPVIYWLGTRLGRFSMRFLKRRVHIAQRNLALCFPEMPAAERDVLVRKNFESVGMGLFETGMAWFWPDWRVHRWFAVSGEENIAMAKAKKQGVLLVGLHFLTLELGARIFGLYNPGIGVYRPHDNKLMDWIQTWGRTRSNKTMLDRKDLKGMIRCLKQGDIIWYAPDHDYGPRASVFAPLFAVPDAATTTGTYLLARMAKPAIIPFVPRRLPDGRGYELVILPDVEDMPLDSELAAATRMNQVVEEAIMMAPDQYMWLHRRFKTRPEGQPSLY
ncbi:LpxL/LpxP family Kdo(2)-lipid IV(A) lauroyl/palmitoleoyl acyltransferasee [Chimaeribacter arupi]|uniref:Lipid A biosynthesis acyltransferase n=2 Tax=Yersiniaceae TaxID=1903411 RepID=A0A2N5ETH6_9GAMM|nr:MULTISPECIES: Kdo(2)-lipid IV(A) acyltransferase [Yersiniaceae]MBS0969879.1 LpxL/LpxP family Kdo(2)-lipid IV(A) lauroyl/palmitoleoyl acyltransferasee [Nissabacter archeti]MDV5139917.1 Kdo(2)-lipid IV(A) acyltransferase [Chimaeribacter arupi]PLR39925.1 lipid A biosynthesis lauroyl acyltransferase [Chimaeribacter arupi]PLR53363.1 lipid A biosynthesis lauroyl acyltransferase [Chimaeribacter arupi]PLR54176.1 lipid A biosynthesis lauroyl acyltransferase [Chimaeribacter arupi]